MVRCSMDRSNFRHIVDVKELDRTHRLLIVVVNISLLLLLHNAAANRRTLVDTDRHEV